jgi:hypothetical protein
MVPGTINVTVNSTGLTPATLAITTVAQQINTVVRDPALMNTLREKAGFLTCARNPGSKKILVGYGVDISGNINLSIVSPSGRMVKCLTNKYHKAGAYSMEWNPMDKSGVYFLVLKTGNSRTVRKAFMVQ